MIIISVVAVIARECQLGGEDIDKDHNREEALQCIEEVINLACEGCGLLHRWLEKVSDGSCYADNGQGGQSDLSASHEMLEEGRPQGNLLGDLLGRRKLLQQEVGAEAFYQGNGDEVADVEPVYGGPQDCSTSENDPDPRNEDEDSEDKNDNDEEPEYGNEDQAVAVAQYAHQDGVTVERNARLLNHPHDVCNRRSGGRVNDRIVAKVVIVTQSICNGTRGGHDDGDEGDRREAGDANNC